MSKPKLLLTGMNKSQCTPNFWKRQQIKLATHYSILAALPDMGYEVEQRPVQIGEDLSKYDKVIVYIHSPSGFAGFVYNALYAIAKRPDCIIAIDDWQTDSIFKGVTDLTDDARLFRPYVVDSHELLPTDWENYKQDIRDGVAAVSAKQHKMLFPVFSGGDVSKLLPVDYSKELLFGYNPNPYHLNRKPGAYGDDMLPDNTEHITFNNKEKVFNFASLVQGKTAKWLKKQNINKWAINYYGSRKDGQDRLTDEEMCKVFAKQWASLLPGYWHTGSGWWRFRHLQVADAQSILIGDPVELNILYRDNALSSIKASDLEDMDVSQLTAIALGQKEALYANHPLDKSTELRELEAALES
jgi:hypothetical protein